jgi:hypothetical protein
VNECQLFLFLSERSSCKEHSETSARSALTKVQSLSLKAQEEYCCSHSSRSVGEAQKPFKECVGSWKFRNYQPRGELKDCGYREVHRVEESNNEKYWESLPQGV